MTPTPPHPRRPRPVGLFALIATTLLTGPAAAQGTYTWAATNQLGNWLTPANWEGFPAGVHPGVASGSAFNGNARDVARINGFATGGAGLGINLSSGGVLSVGAIHLASAPTGVTDVAVASTGNSTTVLQLNGAAVPIGGYSNVILANTTSPSLSIQNAFGGGNQLMLVRLGTTNGTVLVNGGRTIWVHNGVDEATAGSGLTLVGGGNLVFNGSVNHSGTTHVAQGNLYFWSSGTGTVRSDIRNDSWVSYDRAGTSTFSGDLSGAGTWAVPTGQLTLSGTNTHTGTTYVVAPHNTISHVRLNFASAGSAGGAAARYHFTDGAVLSARFAVDQAFLNRIDPASRGYIDLLNNTANPLDFSALPNVSLGTTGVGAVIIVSGAITPAGDTYRLGGGTATLTVASVLGGAGRGLLVTGPVSPLGANTYGGPTVIDVGGDLQLTSLPNAGAAGPVGASSADPANLVIRGGTLTHTAPAGTRTTDRGLTILGGATYNGVSTSGGESILRFDGGLVRGPRATLNATAAVSLGLTRVDGMPLADVPINGIIPWATVGTGTNVVFAGLGTGSTLGGTGGTGLAGAGPTTNVVVTTAQSVAADQAINSLRTNNADVTVASGATLTLTSGGLILRPGTVSVPSLLGGGKLTSGNVVNGTAELYVHTGVAGLSPSRIDPAVIDNGVTPLVLVKHGNGGLALRGANTHSGGTVVNGGTVYLENPSALGTGPVTINPGPVQGNTRVSGLLSRTAAGTYTHPITVTAAAGGTVVIGTETPLPAPAVFETTFTGPVTFARPLTLQGGNPVGTRFTGRLSGGASDVTIASINETTGTFPVILDSAQPNTFGNLYLGRNAFLQLGAAGPVGNNQVPDAATVYFAPRAQLTVFRAAPGTADGETVGALVSQTPGSGRIFTTHTQNGSAPFTLTIGAGNGSGEFGGAIQQFGPIGPGGAPLTLVKTGTGTQVLTGLHTYTGGTRVEAGTLLVNNAVTFSFLGLGDGRVDVGVNGTLGGNGAFSTAGQGTHVAGTLTAGTGAGFGRNSLEIGYGIEMLPGSRFLVRVFGTGPDDASYADVTGQGLINTDQLVLDLTGVDPAALRAAVGVGNSRTYTVMTATDLVGTGFTPGGFSVVNDPGFLPGEWVFDSFDTANDRVTIRFSPAPEPAAVLGVAAAALAAGWWVRRKSAVTPS